MTLFLIIAPQLSTHNLYYFDRILAMGLSSSCAIFESFSTALEWLSVNHLGACAVLHVLDDFQFLAKARDQCNRDLKIFMIMCNHIGVPLAPEKTVGPATVLQFLLFIFIYLFIYLFIYTGNLV